MSKQRAAESTETVRGHSEMNSREPTGNEAILRAKESELMPDTQSEFFGTTPIRGR
jgi:hypothetical protein